MSNDKPPAPDLYGEPEDTQETGWLAHLPLIGWLRRTSRSLGQARGVLLVLGWLCLLGLALKLGWPKLEQLSFWLVQGLHRGWRWLAETVSRLSGSSITGGLSPPVRHYFASWLALLWGGFILLRVLFLCWPQRSGQEDLGYIQPGSGRLARAWALVGRQLYRLRRAMALSFAYLRDLSLEKIYLPAAALVLAVLGGVSATFVMENVFFELHLLLPGVFPASGWMRPLAAALAALSALVLGLPLIAEAFRQTQRRARERRERGRKLPGRLLAGLGGLVGVLLPVLWMGLGLLSGELWP